MPRFSFPKRADYNNLVLDEQLYHWAIKNNTGRPDCLDIIPDDRKLRIQLMLPTPGGAPTVTVKHQGTKKQVHSKLPRTVFPKNLQNPANPALVAKIIDWTNDAAKITVTT